ncbi:MAG: glucose-6-phosphate isomerase [Oligoflexia bacterium]|nr:glucose-6-phosphate isomerase [Oligoflexia bacterium]
MSVTASRLGSAPVTLDWSNLISMPAAGGAKTSPTGATRGVDAQALAEAWEKLRARFLSGEVGFYDAPIREELSQAKESQALAEAILARKRFTDCLFLGIGGSALGPISLLDALQERCRTGIRFHFMENPDPVAWKATLGGLKPDSTLVCVVAKSGTTFETLAQLLLALEWLGPSRISSNCVAITDPEKGDLRAYANQEKIPTLTIAPSIGGRFSIFSPVGLFAAALAGLSISDFLLGAKQVRDYCERQPLEKNPIFVLAHEFLRHSPQRAIHVCMPYSSRLRLLGTWFVQLWGESLGKDGKGFTPLAAVGATDQHSILQLLRDGPNDKVVLFLSVDQVEDEVRIPKLTTSAKSGLQEFPAFRLLEGHSLQELLRVENRATSLVLTRQGRPNTTIQLDRLDERTLGALYFAFSVLTAITGTLWGINPFDQPGVEEGKVYIREALSSDGRRPPENDGNSPVDRLRRLQSKE